MAFQTKTIFSVIYKTVFDLFIYTIIISVILAVLPKHLFSNFPFEPTSYELHNFSISFNDWNNLLDEKSEFLSKDLIVGPESIAEHNGLLYTGLADGRLVQIDTSANAFKVIARFTDNSDCGDNQYWKLTQCGRPLGVRSRSDGFLYVLDAFQGLFRINTSSGQKDLIEFAIDDNLRGLYNDFVIDEQLNVVYITVSSTKWQLDRVPWAVLEYERSGHVFAVDLNTGKALKLVSNLRFTNGIEISNENLIFVETMTFRIYKISLKSVHKAIKSNRQVLDSDISIFAENLIGEADNIRADTNGNLWVGIFVARKDGKNLRDYLANFPFVRKAIGRLVYIGSVILDYINKNICENHALETLAFDLYSGHLFYSFMPTYGAILRLDSTTGEVKQLLGSSKLNGISEVIIDSRGDLYYGSFRNRFLGRVKKDNF